MRAPPTSPGPAPRSWGWWLPLPAALAVAAYARVLDAPFQFDDARAIEGQARLRNLGAVLREAPAALARAGRPLTELTFALDRALGGGAPRPFHLTSLAIHLTVVALVFLFTRRVLRLAGAGGADGVALAVAGAFALHPLQTEAVSYLSQRSESLAAGLALGTLLLLLEAERRGWTAGAVGAQLGALATFTLALSAKVVALTAPAAWLLLLAVVPGAAGWPDRAAWRRRLILVAPLLVVGAWLAVATLGALETSASAGFGVAAAPGPGAVGAASRAVSPWAYLLTEVRAQATYLRLLLWPSGQSVDWDLPHARGPLDPAVLGAGALLAAVLVTAALLVRRGWRAATPAAGAARVAGLGLLWFFLLLSPTSSVVPLADPLAEHRVYLAGWGVLVALALGGQRLLERAPAPWRRRLAAGAVAIAWGTLGLASFARNAAWESPLALWSDAVAGAPHNARARANLGQARWASGDTAGAVREYQIALGAIEAQRPAERPRVLIGLGGALISAGRPGEAVAPLRQALALAPGDADAPAGLATALLKIGDLDGAEAAARWALARRPDHGEALQALGAVAMSRGDAAGAVAAFERALQASPDDAVLLFNAGVTYAAAGRPAAACDAWRRAGHPGSPPLVRARAASTSRAAGCAER